MQCAVAAVNRLPKTNWYSDFKVTSCERIHFLIVSRQFDLLKDTINSLPNAIKSPLVGAICFPLATALTKSLQVFTVDSPK